MSEKPLDLDAVQHQIDAVQIETWLPLPVVRVLELTPAMLQEIKDLRQVARSQKVRELHKPVPMVPGLDTPLVCDGCENPARFVYWPCPTIRALEHQEAPNRGPSVTIPDEAVAAAAKAMYEQRLWETPWEDIPKAWRRGQLAAARAVLEAAMPWLQATKNGGGQ